MTISKEIINLVKIKLVSGQRIVDIVRELKVSVRTVQFVANGQRTKARLFKNKVDMSVKRAMKKISNEGSRVSTKKVSQLLRKKRRQALSEGDYLEWVKNIVMKQIKLS